MPTSMQVPACTGATRVRVNSNAMRRGPEFLLRCDLDELSHPVGVIQGAARVRACQTNCFITVGS